MNNLPIKQSLTLVNEMARLSLKADARRYFFGYLWWILEPLLWVGVFYLVFEVLLNSGRADFLVFLAVGKLTFIWFSKSVTQAANSLIGNRGLIGKMDAPKWLFPLAVCHEGVYKQMAVFGLLIALMLSQGYAPSVSWLWLLPLALTQYLLIVGCGMAAAVLVCVRRDFQLLVQLGMVFLLFVSGIFWDIDSIGNAAFRENLLLVNPMASLIDLYRSVLMDGSAPPIRQWLTVLVESIAMLALPQLGIPCPALLDRPSRDDPMSALLTLENVGMHFAVRPDHESGQHTVFEGINLTLNKGDRLGIIGRNGAGKSTLLRIMAKIYAPAAGTVTWAPGVTVSLLSLGLGFKNELSGRDNAYIAGLLQGLTKNDAKQSIGSIEEFCELGKYFDEPMNTYSLGMRARLGFASALLNRASVLLIDEVLSVGDKEFREKAKTALKDQLEFKQAIVLVSHSETQLLDMCNAVRSLNETSLVMRRNTGLDLVE